MAVNARKRKETFRFSCLKGKANVLIFPDLQSCNIAARLLPQLGQVDAQSHPFWRGETRTSAAAQR